MYKGVCESEAVAVKRLILPVDASERAKSRAFKELRHEGIIMSQLKHPRIVQLKGIHLRLLCDLDVSLS